MNKKGFTLIEVITVIVIIALVLAIASPNIFKFSDRANEKALKTKISNLATITEDYVEHNSYDIVDKCGNGSCMCSSFKSTESGYECLFPISILVNLKLYNEPCNKENKDCVCKIADPTDANNADKCLEEKWFRVSFNPNSNIATATLVE